MIRRLAALALSAGLLAAAPALAETPRETVAHVAKAIEDIYFDPARGKAVADDLRAAAERGEFDAFTDPRDLATALTRRLSPIDHHFNVIWNPGDDAPPPGGAGPVMVRRPPGAPAEGGLHRPAPPPGQMSPDAQARRGAYGFRRVEILPGAIGYIDMRQFAGFDFHRANDPARLAAEAALTMISGADAVIIDLRDNGGGSPAMVGYLVSAFTPKGADIYNVFHSRQGTESEAPEAYYPNPRLDVPVYVLTSGRTGSAAEAFAYTLQAARRATIVGEASGGAANPGGFVPVGGGYRVFVSGGSPVNPITKGNWEGTGVQPDVAVPAADALTRARVLALEAVLAKRPDGPEAIDTRWTLEALKAELDPPAAPSGLDAFAGTYGDLVVTRAGSGLSMQRGRRPASILVPLGGSTFFVQGEPSRRVVFEQDASGKVVAMELRLSSGQVTRFRR